MNKFWTYLWKLSLTNGENVKKRLNFITLNIFLKFFGILLTTFEDFLIQFEHFLRVWIFLWKLSWKTETKILNLTTANIFWHRLNISLHNLNIFNTIWTFSEHIHENILVVKEKYRKMLNLITLNIFSSCFEHFWHLNIFSSFFGHFLTQFEDFWTQFELMKIFMNTCLMETKKCLISLHYTFFLNFLIQLKQFLPQFEHFLNY